MRVAIYPGSFDPLTNGHLSMIQRGLDPSASIVCAICGASARNSNEVR